MKHFLPLPETELNSLFQQRPTEYGADASKDVLSMALGATLYTPSIKDDLPATLQKVVQHGVTTSVLCLEDSIPDDRVEEGEDNVLTALDRIGQDEQGVYPLIFIRVRTPEQLAGVARRLTESAARVTVGFVMPKFSMANGVQFMEEIVNASTQHDKHFWGMPVLESRTLIYEETRVETLQGIQRVLNANRDHVLAVRIGATDLLSAFSLRRSRDLTIYDVHVVASVIGAVVNMFGRENGFTISGPVWEHFGDRERLFRPTLRSSPFDAIGSSWVRNNMISNDLDGLLREVELDRANGLIGKTIIHPTHASLVNSMLVVTAEEYQDALDILEKKSGVMASALRNKMNEAKPHFSWAEQTLRRASIFGVLRPEINLVDLQISMARFFEEKNGNKSRFHQGVLFNDS